MAQILTETDEWSPIPRPHWLIIHTLHQECESIFNHAQSQPTSDMGWRELSWAYRTIDLLPPLAEESTWSEDTSIPPFFVYQESEPAPEICALYDMVNIF